MAGHRLSLEGKTFGTLRVLELSHSDKKHGTMWTCQCSCGNEHIVRGSHLTAGTVYRCPSCKFTAMRNPDAVGDMSVLYWHQIINGATRRGLSVEVTHEEAYQKYLDQDRKCALSGVPIIFPPRSNRPELNTASLDRIDSSVGYTISNIQWVHKLINRMKMNLPDTEFVTWCKVVSTYHD